jgi:hypothetical protein
MKVNGYWPQDGVEGRLRLFDQQGRDVTDQLQDEKGQPLRLSHWSWEPTFFNPTAKPIVQYLQSSDKDDNAVQRAVLVVSGTTGKIDLQDRTRPVVARLDQKRKPAAEEDDEDSDEPEPELPLTGKGK